MSLKYSYMESMNIAASFAESAQTTVYFMLGVVKLWLNNRQL